MTAPVLSVNSVKHTLVKHYPEIFIASSHKTVLGSIINVPVLKGRELYRLKSKTKNYTEEGSASSQAQP